jgi:hypothetical protein
MRTLYETPSDLANEEQVKEHLEKIWLLKLHKLNINYKWDFAVYNPTNSKIYGMAEIRCRNVKPFEYPSIMMSLNKWESGLQFVQCGLEIWFVVKFSDGTLWSWNHSEGDEERISIEIGGRNQLRDEWDVEPVVHLPNSLFQEIS